MRIDFSGNVGIGTTSPISKVEIIGGTRSLAIGEATGGNSVGLQLMASGVKHAGLRFDGTKVYLEDASSSRDPNIWYSGTATDFIVRNGNVKGTGLCIGDDCRTSWPSGGLTGSGTTSFVPKWTSASALGNSLIYDTGTNVGIGTASPTQKLDVTGYVKGQSGVCIGNDCRTGWPSPSGWVKIMSQSTSGSYTVAVDVPSGCISNMCQLFLVMKGAGARSANYIQDSTGIFYGGGSASSLNGIYFAGTNGDSTQSGIIVLSDQSGFGAWLCEFSDDMSGTETSAAQWSVNIKIDSNKACEIWVNTGK